MASGIGSSAKEAALDVAFNDPNADKAFVGSSISARSLMGAAMGGPLGFAMQASSPQDFSRTNAVAPTTGMLAAGGEIGSAAGFGLALLSKGGMKAKVAGTIAGGLIGGVVAPTLGTMSFVGANRNFYSQSPYANKSSATAAALNASGDIVLGMHNSRGGY